MRKEEIRVGRRYKTTWNDTITVKKVCDCCKECDIIFYDDEDSKNNEISAEFIESEVFISTSKFEEIE